MVPFHEDTLWGYKNNQGAVIIKPQFQYASKFKVGVAIVGKNNKLGAIDKNNNLLIPFHYEFLSPLEAGEFLFGQRAKYFGEYIMGVMTSDEKVKIPAEYNNISKYQNTYLVTKHIDSIIGKGNIGDVRSVQSLYGLFDSNGKVLIPCQYDYISWINDSLLVVTKDDSGKNKALFTKKGEQLTGFKYMVFGQFIEGVAKVRIGDKYGFMYPTGKIAVPIKFDYCEDFFNGYAIIQQSNKWGAIQKDGKVIIEPKFDYGQVKAILKEKFDR